MEFGDCFFTLKCLKRDYSNNNGFNIQNYEHFLQSGIFLVIRQTSLVLYFPVLFTYLIHHVTSQLLWGEARADIRTPLYQ